MGPDSLRRLGLRPRPQDRERSVYCITIIIMNYNRNAMAADGRRPPGNNRTTTNVSRGRRRIALAGNGDPSTHRGPGSLLGNGGPECDRTAARRAPDVPEPANPAQAGAADSDGPSGADRGQ